jgi:putative CocE/NonD family hydrolase
MRRVTLALLASISFFVGWSTSAAAATQNTRLSMTIAGQPIGDCAHETKPDGAFSSHSTLAGNSASLKGRFDKDGRILAYICEVVLPQGKVTLTLEDGKLSVIAADDKPVEVPYDASVRTYCSRGFPGIASSLLRAVDFSKKQAQTIPAFEPESGMVLQPKVTPLGEQSIQAGSVRQYRVEVEGTSATYSMTNDGRVVAVLANVNGLRLQMVADGWEDLLDPFVKYPELTQPTFKVKQLPTQRLRTRDGVELVQEVFLPEGQGPFPVVLVRTPYGRSRQPAAAEMYVKRGYAYVEQDCRGRNDSQGEWDPFVHEINDGYDTLDWIAQQPWCDGNVGMIGASYGGFVQWAAAASHHPALKCIVPQVSPPADAMRNLPYDDGIFLLRSNTWWGNIVRQKRADMSGVLRNPKGFSTLPLSKVDNEVIGHDLPFFNRWLERTTHADWKGWSFYGEFNRITVPALHISGWWDGDEIGTSLNWEAMRAAKRTDQWLIYGPWAHGFNISTKFGDVDYGDSAVVDLDTLYVRWFDSWLKRKDVGINAVPRVQAFVTGANKWVTGGDWPLPESREQTFYLSAGGPATGEQSQGRLVATPPAEQRPTIYTYDPAKDEVPPEMLDPELATPTTRVDEFLSRKDALIFKTEPLAKPLTIAGPYEVELHFRSSALDTDFFVTFVDIDEKGAMRVFGQSGKIKASYLNGFDKQVPLTPGKTYVARIRPWDSAHELKAGHRLGLVITSSMFPEYARNLGTAEPIKDATRMVEQTNTILHNAQHPSCIRLRVL